MCCGLHVLDCLSALLPLYARRVSHPLPTRVHKILLMIAHVLLPVFWGLLTGFGVLFTA